MIVYYRMTDVPSTNPSPVLQENKFELNKLCLRSFEGAFINLCPKIHFILDHCDDRYPDMINKIIGWDYEISKTELGINGTMNLSYNLASKTDDVVLFCECDYLWVPNSGPILHEAIGQLGLVSPYDHRNFYLDRNIHSQTCDLSLVNNHHFRTTERNTMTWGCHSRVVKDNYHTLVKYGYLDDLVWRDLRYAGLFLNVPIPSLATHMVRDYLAPGVEWSEVWQQYQ